jgi:hypothetical protein
MKHLFKKDDDFRHESGAGFIKYIVIIVVILVVVFFSQQGRFSGEGKTSTFVNGTVEQVEASVAKGSGWVIDKVFPNIAGEVQKRGEMVKEGVEKEKEKISETATEKIKNYFTGITDSILHPEENNNCDCKE